MKITICGSLQFIDDMVKAQKVLEAQGHTVIIPPLEIPDKDGKLIPITQMYEIYKNAGPDDVWVWNWREFAMRDHYRKIADSHIVLIMNLEKNGVPGYIGINTMMEMGLAFYLNKAIYLYNPVPNLPYQEEIRGMKPRVINGNLSEIWV
jgi:hypothetical protein